MSQTTQLEAENEARTAVKTLEVDDVIRIPQYKGALKVTFVSEPSENMNGIVGVEFVDEGKAANGASKSLIVRSNTGRVDLLAGHTDKGEVETIETVVKGSSDEEDTDETEGEEDGSGLDEEPVETDDEDVEITKLTSRRTGKVVYEIVQKFEVHGDPRTKTMAAHHDGTSWVLNGHQGFGNPGRITKLARAESKEEILSIASITES